MFNDFPLEDAYVYQLEKAVRHFRKYSKDFFKANGVDITGEQWIIIKRIAERPGIPQHMIAELTYKDPAAVTRTLDILEKKKLVKRVANESDRRAFELKLTKKGENVYSTVTPLAKKINDQGMKKVSKAEQKVFLKVLKDLISNYS